MVHYLEARHINLESTFGAPALVDISCRFTSSELSVVTGQNGSGKTALLRTLRGLSTLSSGELKLDAQNLPLRDPDTHRKIAFLPQDPYTSLIAATVFDDLLLSAIGSSDSDRKKIVNEAMDKFGLSAYAHCDPRKLPFGKLRLHNAACAMMTNPDFVLLDDPFSGLDLFATQLVLKELLTLKKLGTSIVLATQDLDRILAHTDHVILLKDGRSIADALPERVLPFLEAHGVRKPNSKLQDMTWLDR